MAADSAGRALPESSSPEPAAVVAAFDVPGNLVAATPFRGGHIHDSYLVTLDEASADIASGASAKAGRRPVRYLLQKINTGVFPQPRLIMENIARIYLWTARSRRGVLRNPRNVLTVVPVRGSELLHVDRRGGCWRMFLFIENTRSYLSVETAAQAEAAARAFGDFQRRLIDLPPPRLHETIPDFHNTPRRLAAFEQAVAADTCGRLCDVRAEVDFLLHRRALADVLLDLHRRGAIPERIVHNDAKISNVLFDTAAISKVPFDATAISEVPFDAAAPARVGVTAAGGTGAVEALCVVDLDTVMPGLSLYDFGDMVRSMSCTAAEDELDCAKVAVEPELYAALARGYLGAAGEFLTQAERAHLVTAGKLITYEQALRFLTDYLCGDTYYRIDAARPGHNLERTRVQLALLESLERQTAELERSTGG